MPGYVTRVSVWFYSEGASPATVIKKLMTLGFTPVRGAYDFIYRHGAAVTDTDIGSAILEISSALHKTLSGFKVLYTLETSLADAEDDYVPLDDIDRELARTRLEIQEVEREQHELEREQHTEN
ncbi:MAG: hypothetical protein HXY34_03040 [Candidatus Thorarchaeota archaeon]|nr:hypothetical protein [Candidatus Thorarchaeota archaeon]